MSKLRLENYKIPDEFKHEFEQEMLKNNFNTFFLISIILLVCEVFLYIIKDKLYNTGNLILVFIIVSVVLIPIIWIIRKKIDVIPSIISKIIQFIYSYVILFFTIALFLVTESQTDLSYLYVTAVLSISFTISLNAYERILLLLPTYSIMAIFLPQFQQNPEIVFVNIINMFIINLIAWVFGFVLRNLEKESFLHGKMLLEKNRLLEQLVKKDSMTGLYNHEASFQKLKEEIDVTNRTGCPLSVIILDIDDFKKVNDSYGHLTGDNVLKKIASLMGNITRTVDIVGRYGGEEFIIILPDTDIEGAKVLMQKIQSELRATSFEKNISITLSGGISQYSVESVDELITMTDKKLYKAKRSGKNRFIYNNKN